MQTGRAFKNNLPLVWNFKWNNLPPHPYVGCGVGQCPVIASCSILGRISHHWSSIFRNVHLCNKECTSIYSLEAFMATIWRHYRSITDDWTASRGSKRLCFFRRVAVYNRLERRAKIAWLDRSFTGIELRHFLDTLHNALSTKQVFCWLLFVTSLLMFEFSATLTFCLSPSLLLLVRVLYVQI